MAFVAVTRPSGEITTCSLTLPLMFMCLASSGYVGGTLVLTFRPASLVLSVCAKPVAPAREIVSMRIIASVDDLAPLIRWLLDLL